MIICEMFGLYEAAGAAAGCAGFSAWRRSNEGSLKVAIEYPIVVLVGLGFGCTYRWYCGHRNVR
jgi:hypothetical protein